MILDLQTGS